MLLKVAIVLIVAVVAFLAYVTTKPNNFLIAQTQAIKATPESVFGLISDLRRFNAWNPFATARRVARALPMPGIAPARQAKGRIEITKASSPSRVSMQLEFIKPFAVNNIAEFIVIPEGGTTKVRRTLSGRNAYFCKLMSTIFNMDKVVGSEFTRGLGNLRALAEH